MARERSKRPGEGRSGQLANSNHIRHSNPASSRHRFASQAKVASHSRQSRVGKILRGDNNKIHYKDYTEHHDYSKESEDEHYDDNRDPDYRSSDHNRSRRTNDERHPYRVNTKNSSREQVDNLGYSSDYFSSDPESESGQSPYEEHRSQSESPRRERSDRHAPEKRKEKPNTSEDYESSDSVLLLNTTPHMRDKLIRELKRILHFAGRCKQWIAKNKPAVSKAKFYERPEFDEALTLDDYEAVVREWNEDPEKALILGGHAAHPSSKKDNKMHEDERIMLAYLYRLFLRLYSCTFDEFMSPKYQLELDCRDRPVVSHNGLQIHDTFPSKQFSYYMRVLITQNIWLGNLTLIATCLQYVNRLRTKDTRPWKLVNCDLESKFFETWQNVVARNSSEEDTRALYLQVKQQLGPQPGFYRILFDQIERSVESQTRTSLETYSSMRTHDDDPYFVGDIDLIILLDALDNVSYWGFPLLRGPRLTSAAILHSIPSSEYPASEEVSSAREHSILSQRVATRKGELRSKAQESSTRYSQPAHEMAWGAQDMGSQRENVAGVARPIEEGQVSGTSGSTLRGVHFSNQFGFVRLNNKRQEERAHRLFSSRKLPVAAIEPVP
ncbi:hypothetical protein F4774DRAFT_428006 [Daldinia eschscholtzii]|nr:hypothetical protein F4774DRAFT_428006 [Daldinia eschscholtzii]